MYIRKAPLGAARHSPSTTCMVRVRTTCTKRRLGTIAAQNGHGFRSDQIRSISFEPPRSVFRPDPNIFSHDITITVEL